MFAVSAPRSVDSRRSHSSPKLGNRTASSIELVRAWTSARDMNARPLYHGTVFAMSTP